jgi:hypothetical protein
VRSSWVVIGGVLCLGRLNTLCEMRDIDAAVAISLNRHVYYHAFLIPIEGSWNKVDVPTDARRM